MVLAVLAVLAFVYRNIIRLWWAVTLVKISARWNAMKVKRAFKKARKGQVPESECKCPPGYYYTPTTQTEQGVTMHCKRLERLQAPYMGNFISRSYVGCGMPDVYPPFPDQKVLPKEEWPTGF